MMPETSGSSLTSLFELTSDVVFPGMLVVKNPLASSGDVNTQVRSLSW